MQNDIKISLVILRLEIDDSTISSSISNYFTSDIFNYNSDINNILHLTRRLHQQDTVSLSLPENITNKDEGLKAFIGERSFRTISIDTFKFAENMSGDQSNQDQLSKSAASSTMQNALETAYSDWNKNKLTKTSNSCDNLDEKVKSLSINDDSKLTNNATTSLSKSENDLKRENIEFNKSKILTEPTTSNNHQQQQSTIISLPYLSGNPTVETIRGILHIYKDNNLTSLNENMIKSEMLCMLGVASTITCNELLNFLTPYSEGLLYMRIIRDNHPNQYMALLKFKSANEANQFYKLNNNKPFNSIEVENICQLVFIESIEAVNSSKGASLPIAGFTELPTCHICLEKMDESLNGVITILCNHAFHANCLSKWGDTNCPVCRYSQTPDFSADSVCTECGSHENLWICLICGHIGCGRYVRGHAYNHFQITQHTYSMQLGSNRVWDYAGDNYVHRLIQNKTDGKLVQLDEAGRVINQDEKIDSITLEYTYLLTVQLESQRVFFEERLFRQEEKAQLQILELECKTSAYQQENSKLKEGFEHLTKEKSSLEKKCSQLNLKLNKLQSELEEEKELNKCLTKNQDAYQEKLTTLENKMKSSEIEKTKQIEDLQAQLRDVMFYLDAQKQFSQSDKVTKEEIQDSHLVIQQENNATASNATPSASSHRRKNKKN